MELDQEKENQAYIDKLIAENQIAESTVNLFQNEINDFIQNHFHCSAKTSFKNCKQKIQGYEQVLVYENGRFYQKLVPCAHLARQLEKDEILNRFYYVNFDPLQKEDFLFVNNNIRMQKDFYNLDFEKDRLQVNRFITNKEEFENKSFLVQNFFEQMDNKQAIMKGKYLVGPMGVGKTNLLKFLALVAANNYQKTVVFTTINDLVNKLKDGFSSEDFNVNRFIGNLAKVDLLVLDDIGSEQVTKWMRDDILFTLLNYRMEHHLLTYFSSNLTWKELEKHYYKINEADVNKKIKVDRLMERIKTLATEFVIQGDNHRQNNK